MYSYCQGRTEESSNKGGSKLAAAALDFFGDLTTGESSSPAAVVGEGQRKDVDGEKSERKRLSRKRKRGKNSEYTSK